MRQSDGKSEREKKKDGYGCRIIYQNRKNHKNMFQMLNRQQKKRHTETE